MRHLTKLTPAETSIILTGGKTTLSELLKYTFLDLLLRKVLTINEVERQASPRDPVRVHKYVLVGSNYMGVQIRPHELALLSIFQKNQEAHVLFKNFVKMAYQNARNERHYLKRLSMSPNLGGIIDTSIVNRVLCKISFTEKGNIIKREIISEIADLEKNVTERLKTDRQGAIETLKSISGNIFLVKSFQLAISKEFEDELFKEMSSRENGTGNGGCWTDFTTYSYSFDNSCGSDDSSGCSGDGGSSGCSGCGGCGGD